MSGAYKNSQMEHFRQSRAQRYFAYAWDANLELSKRRAEAVVNLLVATYRIDKNRLTPVGVSFACPVASNTTEEGRAKNRRVELVEN